jgi:hypothetical protein
VAKWNICHLYAESAPLDSIVVVVAYASAGPGDEVVVVIELSLSESSSPKQLVPMHDIHTPLSSPHGHFSFPRLLF